MLDRDFLDDAHAQALAEPALAQIGIEEIGAFAIGARSTAPRGSARVSTRPRKSARVRLQGEQGAFGEVGAGHARRRQEGRREVGVVQPLVGEIEA